MRRGRESSDDGGRPRRPGGWLLRSLVVLALAFVIALVVLVRPLRELSQIPSSPSGGDPTVAANARLPTRAATQELVGGAPLETPTATPTATARPTHEPSNTSTPAPTPTLPPSATPSPTQPLTPSGTPTPVPSPSNTPEPPPTVTVEPTTPVALTGRVEDGVYFSGVTNREESYRVYLPPGYDKGDRRYPVLYLLHGWPYDESHWDGLGVDEVADGRIAAGTLNPFIIVLPGADPGGTYVTTSGGAQSFEEQLVNELMPHIDATYRSVQTRDARAIGGISRGGVWALEIAFRHPDAFRIVGAHSPALSANRAPSAFDPFTLLTGPGVDALRIYLSAGDADWARPATEDLHRALGEQGIEHQFALHAGLHRDALWSQHLDEYLTFYAAGW